MSSSSGSSGSRLNYDQACQFYSAWTDKLKSEGVKEKDALNRLPPRERKAMQDVVEFIKSTNLNRPFFSIYSTCEITDDHTKLMKRYGFDLVQTDGVLDGNEIHAKKKSAEALVPKIEQTASLLKSLIKRDTLTYGALQVAENFDLFKEKKDELKNVIKYVINLFSDNADSKNISDEILQYLSGEKKLEDIKNLKVKNFFDTYESTDPGKEMLSLLKTPLIRDILKSTIKRELERTHLKVVNELPNFANKKIDAITKKEWIRQSGVASTRSVLQWVGTKLGWIDPVHGGETFTDKAVQLRSTLAANLSALQGDIHLLSRLLNEKDPENVHELLRNGINFQNLIEKLRGSYKEEYSEWPQWLKTFGFYPPLPSIKTPLQTYNPATDTHYEWLYHQVETVETGYIELERRLSHVLKESFWQGTYGEILYEHSVFLRQNKAYCEALKIYNSGDGGTVLGDGTTLQEAKDAKRPLDEILKLLKQQPSVKAVLDQADALEKKAEYWTELAAQEKNPEAATTEANLALTRLKRKFFGTSPPPKLSKEDLSAALAKADQAILSADQKHLLQFGQIGIWHKIVGYFGMGGQRARFTLSNQALNRLEEAQRIKLEILTIAYRNGDTDEEKKSYQDQAFKAANSWNKSLSVVDRFMSWGKRSADVHYSAELKGQEFKNVDLDGYKHLYMNGMKDSGAKIVEILSAKVAAGLSLSKEEVQCAMTLALADPVLRVNLGKLKDKGLQTLLTEDGFTRTATTAFESVQDYIEKEALETVHRIDSLAFRGAGSQDVNNPRRWLRAELQFLLSYFRNMVSADPVNADTYERKAERTYWILYGRPTASNAPSPMEAETDDGSDTDSLATVNSRRSYVADDGSDTDSLATVDSRRSSSADFDDQESLYDRVLPQDSAPLSSLSDQDLRLMGEKVASAQIDSEKFKNLLDAFRVAEEAYKDQMGRDGENLPGSLEECQTSLKAIYEFFGVKPVPQLADAEDLTEMATQLVKWVDRRGDRKLYEEATQKIHTAANEISAQLTIPLLKFLLGMQVAIPADNALKNPERTLCELLVKLLNSTEGDRKTQFGQITTALTALTNTKNITPATGNAIALLVNELNTCETTTDPIAYAKAYEGLITMGRKVTEKLVKQNLNLFYNTNGAVGLSDEGARWLTSLDQEQLKGLPTSLVDLVSLLKMVKTVWDGAGVTTKGKLGLQLRALLNDPLTLEDANSRLDTPKDQIDVALALYIGNHAESAPLLEQQFKETLQAASQRPALASMVGQWKSFIIKQLQHLSSKGNEVAQLARQWLHQLAKEDIRGPLN